MAETMAELNPATHDDGRPATALDGREPLDLPAARGGPLASRLECRLIWMFLVLGIAARTVRYLLWFPLWEDEAFIGANLLGAVTSGCSSPWTTTRSARSCSSGSS